MSSGNVKLTGLLFLSQTKLFLQNEKNHSWGRLRERKENQFRCQRPFYKETMEREIIRHRASNLKDKNDLLFLLNDLKKEDMSTSGTLETYHPMTIRHINYYCNPNHTFHRYRQFHISKKSGGTRIISAPYNKTYMLILTYLNEILKACYEPTEYATGFAEGRSIADNAIRHIGQNYILNIDLKDFFSSVEKSRVWGRLMAKPFSFNQAMANLIAGLCSMKEVREENGEKREYYVLPQGAPTSPIITNMICDNLDRRMGGLARRFGLNYSRYADDITFSSMHYVYSERGEFWSELNRIIKEQRFTINEKKVRLQKRGDRQEVTGIVVSDKINVPKEYVRNIRNILYIWEKYGLQAAYSRFLPHYKADKGHVKKGVPDLVNVIDGKLMYLKMIKGDNDSVYVRLHTKFMKLLESSRTVENTNFRGVSFVEKCTVKEFEMKYSEVFICKGKNDKRYAYYISDGSKVYMTVSKDIKDDDKKEQMMVSSCINSHNDSFLLLHKANKTTVFEPEKVDLDKLINDLDDLINAS